MPIEFKKVNFEYSPNTPFSYHALKDIDLELSQGKMTAIIGATGSGKTTLVQHLNALLLPTSGEVDVLGKKIIGGEKPKNLKELRRQVGLVFQFPEYQLFEETILKDVAFGPKNFGLGVDDCQAKAKKALQDVGIEPEYFERSPLDLSGGQKRRVAIAGILAMDPSVLVLDEPTAGLDPAGMNQMMSLFRKFNQERKQTVLLVTHNMEQVINYCDEVVVVHDGKIIVKDTVNNFFQDIKLLKETGIEPPAIITIQEELKEKGFNLTKTYLDIDSLAEAIAKKVGK